MGAGPGLSGAGPVGGAEVAAERAARTSASDIVRLSVPAREPPSSPSTATPATVAVSAAAAQASTSRLTRSPSPISG
ncbi:hypothetical protein GCM10020219_022960 [Nonomuraea dietziae]